MSMQLLHMGTKNRSSSMILKHSLHVLAKQSQREMQPALVRLQRPRVKKSKNLRPTMMAAATKKAAARRTRTRTKRQNVSHLSSQFLSLQHSFRLKDLQGASQVMYSERKLE